MGGNKAKKVGARPYKKFTPLQLERALFTVTSNLMSEREASLEFGVPKSTINRKRNNKNLLSVGRQCVFIQEEQSLVTGLVTASKWGFPLTAYAVRLIAKEFLDNKGIIEKRFKDNFPGYDWVKSFLERNNSILTVRLSENIKRATSNITVEMLSDFYSELSETLDGVSSDCILNYDETNLTDDPGKTKVICRRGAKHVEYLIDSSKSSTSVMFCGSASGTLLPIYIVYKAEHLYPSWTYNAPKGTRFNRSKSGWFDMKIFEDWCFEIVLPYFNSKGPGKKVMIGDNLASHVSSAVIKSG